LALSKATELRKSYLESGSAGTAQAQLNPILEALVDEIELVEADLARLRSGDPEADPILAAERAALESQLSSAVQERASLEAKLLDPDLAAEARAEAEERLSSVAFLIETVESRLSLLPESPEPTIDSATRLQILVLERRLRDLEAQYVAAALRQNEVGSEGLVGESYVIDLTGDEFSLVTASLVGLLASCMAGIAAVIAWDRINDPIRSSDDLASPLLVSVAQRDESGDDLTWYLTSRNATRRSNIQKLRAQIDRPTGGSVVLVEPVDSDITLASASLAVDLAASLATTGFRVILIDTNFGGEDPMMLTEPENSLAKILAEETRTITDHSRIKEALSESPELAPNLVFLKAGSTHHDPADLLAGSNLATVIQQAKELVDAIVLIGPALGAAGADEVEVHATSVIPVIKRHRIRRDVLIREASRLEATGCEVPAVALVD
jgi:hypothetical protein